MPDSLCCLGCWDTESESPLLYLPCGEHAMCTVCLRERVELATKEEAYYPPGCGGSECPNIPYSLIEGALDTSDDAELLEVFQIKVKEYAAPPSERTYCANLSCCAAGYESRYLDAEDFGEGTMRFCPDCTLVTCAVCKRLRPGDAVHNCKAGDQDDEMASFLNSVPEESRWLLQKCYRCGRWIEKSEACNHMSCHCSAEFCLICGRRWEGLLSCRWGCPKYERAVYDADGFNQNGYDPTTGLDRNGLPWDPNHEHEPIDDGEEYDFDGYDRYGYDRDGYDREGRDAGGYDAEGYDQGGYDRDGYDRRGFDRWGYDVDEFNKFKLDRSGQPAPGYYIAPDGNVRRDFDEGPDYTVLNCHHQWIDRAQFESCDFCAGNVAPAGRWCMECGTHSCRSCAEHPELMMQRLRERYPWPGSDPYGIDAMFEGPEFGEEEDVGDDLDENSGATLE